MLGDIIIAKLIAYIAFVGFNKNIYISKMVGGILKGQKSVTNLVVTYGYTLIKKIIMITYFENLNVRLHLLYFVITHIKFVPIRCYLLLN